VTTSRRATLAKIRVDDPDTIDREPEEIKDSLDEKPGAWSELLQPVVKAALVVGVGLAILQQVTGIGAADAALHRRQRDVDLPFRPRCRLQDRPAGAAHSPR
jgi:hypothetical protein